MYPQNSFSNRPASTEPQRSNSMQQVHHQGYQPVVMNNYQQYYTQTNWDNHHTPPEHARMGSHGETTTARNVYSGSTQNVYGPNLHPSQWNIAASNNGREAPESWNSSNWEYRDWQHRESVPFSANYPPPSSDNSSRFHSLNPQELSAQKSSSATSNPSMAQNSHENNYQRTLQYVQQCQTNWNSELDKTSQPN